MVELVIIFLLIGYAFFKEYISYREREKLEMKLMSKDLTEYSKATEPPARNAKEEPYPFIPVEDATYEQILKAKDEL